MNKRSIKLATKVAGAPPNPAAGAELKTEWERAGEAWQKAYDTLERRIEKRTTDLVKANDHLLQEIEERKKTENELKRIKEYLENVIDNSVDAIGIVDRLGHFLLWNRRAGEIYGYAFQELAGKTAFDLYADPATLDSMLLKLRREGVVREHEIAMKKKDGSIVSMDISISLLKDDQGKTIGSVCVARDLSRWKKYEMELERTRDELGRYSRDLERQVRERTREINSILRYRQSIPERCRSRCAARCCSWPDQRRSFWVACFSATQNSRQRSCPRPRGWKWPQSLSRHKEFHIHHGVAT